MSNKKRRKLKRIKIKFYINKVLTFLEYKVFIQIPDT